MAKSWWLAPADENGVVRYEASPWAFWPPDMAESFRDGRLSHPLLERVRDLLVGAELAFDPRDEAILQSPQSRELFHIGLEAVTNGGVFECWECAADAMVHIKRTA